MPRITLILAALAGLMTASAAYAQDRTGTGGGPSSTITAPHTSSVGQTKPPSGGNASTATADAPRDVRSREQIEDDKIARGICIGCGPK